MLILENSRLKLEMEEPGEDYRGPRYDWSSFISQITLDKKHTFLGVESLIPGDGSGGKGLCGELSMFIPLAFDEIEPGSQFPKPGVGELTRLDNSDYRFSGVYPCAPAKWQTTQEDNAVIFSYSQPLLHGYAYNYEKKIYLTSNQLHAEYSLKNTGKRDINTHEYCHNYINLDNSSIDSGYQVNLNFNPELDTSDTPLLKDNNIIKFIAAPQEAFCCQDITSCVGFENSSWTISKNKLSVTEILDKPIMKFALFATDHAVCPELFVDIKAPIGETFSWKRTWTFDAA